MRSNTPSEGSQDGVASLSSSPALSVRSIGSSRSGAAPPPSEIFNLSPSVTNTMGLPRATPPASPAAPPGLASPAPAYSPLVSLDLLVFLNFLMAHLDLRGMCQALFWLLSPFGNTIIQPCSVIVHRLRQDIDCYALVTDFVAQGGGETLFKLKILG